LFTTFVTRVAHISFQAAADGGMINGRTRRQFAADLRLANWNALVGHRVAVAIVGTIVVGAAFTHHNRTTCQRLAVAFFVGPTGWTFADDR